MKNTLVTLSFLLVSVTCPHLVFAETRDRPSAQSPKLPDYFSEKKDNAFILPPVLPETAVTPNLLNTRKIHITHIHLKDNKLFSEQELRPLITPYEQREVSIAELENLRQKLTHYYTDKGYIDSGAVFISESFNKGELTVRFIEGHIDAIRLHGLERLNSDYVKNRLLADENAPLNINELQDNFQKLLSNPLIKQMNGRILPSNQAGHSILDVSVIRARSYHWSLVANNYRPPSIGAEAFGLNASVNNLTGYGDTFDVTFITSEGSNRYAGGFTIPLTASETLAFFHFDAGDSSLIEAPISSIQLNSKINSLEGGFSQAVINRLNQQFIIGTLLAVRENKTYSLDKAIALITENPRNQATVWRLFQDYNQHWQHHALVLRSTFSLGINTLGATARTNNYPSGEFFAWLGQGQYAYLLHEDSGTQAVIRANAQFSDLHLLPLEQLAVGGVNTVRGYRENYLVRDQGYNFSFELHYPLLGSTDTTTKVNHRLTLIPFVDYGEAWNQGESGASIYSIGIGCQWHYRFVQSEVFYGYALNYPSNKQSGDIQDNGIHVQLKLADAF